MLEIKKRVLLEAGYYGSNCEQLGAYSYRGYDVLVSQEMGMPKAGEVFHVGIYNEGDYDAIDVNEYEGYSLEKACQIVDEMIDDIKRVK